MTRNDRGPAPLDRRTLLAGAVGAAVGLRLGPALATTDTMRTAMKAFTGEAPVTAGRVSIEIPALVENGNSVPLTVRVESPMSEADHVSRIALFNERNPQPNIAVFHLSPRSGRAQVSTRIRLGDSQTIAAIAQTSDGRFWSATAELVVTLPACVEN